MAVGLEQQQHVQSEAKLFNEPIMKRLKLQPFPLEYMDIESDYMLELENKMAPGYDPEQPITVCTSDDPGADRFVSDGRHRLVIAARFEKSNGKPYNVTIKHVEVKNLEEAYKLQMIFETEHVARKTPKKAIDHIHAIWEKIRELRFGKQVSLRYFFTEEDAKNYSPILINTLTNNIKRYEKRKALALLVGQDTLEWDDDDSDSIVEQQERTTSYTTTYDDHCDDCGKSKLKTFNVTLKEPGGIVTLEEI